MQKIFKVNKKELVRGVNLKMRINSIASQNFANCAPEKKHSNNIAFKATPQQILKAVDEAIICRGKKNFLGSIGEFFEDLQSKMATIKDAPKEFIYKLDQKNNIPESIANAEINGLTLAKVDSALTNSPFKCSPTSTCGCGAGKTKGELAMDLFEKIGVEEPSFIKISKG